MGWMNSASGKPADSTQHFHQIHTPDSFPEQRHTSDRGRNYLSCKALESGVPQQVLQGMHNNNRHSLRRKKNSAGENHPIRNHSASTGHAACSAPELSLSDSAAPQQ